MRAGYRHGDVPRYLRHGTSLGRKNRYRVRVCSAWSSIPSRFESEVSNPDGPVTILRAELGVQGEDVPLASNEGAAKAIVLSPIAVEEHIHIYLSHKATRATVVQLAFRP